MTAKHILKVRSKMEDQGLKCVTKEAVAVAMATHIIEAMKEDIEESVMEGTEESVMEDTEESVTESETMKDFEVRNVNEVGEKRIITAEISDMEEAKNETEYGLEE